MSDTAQRVRSLISRELHVDLDQVVDTAQLHEDLAADHIDVVSIVMELEDEFKVTITEDELDALGRGTVADVIALVTAAPVAAAA